MSSSSSDSIALSSLQSILADLTEQNRLLTQLYFSYDASVKSALTQLSLYSSSDGCSPPSKGSIKASSSSQTGQTKSPAADVSRTSRLDQAEEAIKNVTKLLSDVVQREQAARTALRDVGVAGPVATNRSRSDSQSSEQQQRELPVTAAEAKSAKPRQAAKSHHTTESHSSAAAEAVNSRRPNPPDESPCLPPRHCSTAGARSQFVNSRSSETQEANVEFERQSKNKEDEKGIGSRDGNQQQLVKPDEVKHLIAEAIARRDEFWRDRLKSESEIQTKSVEMQLKQSMAQRYIKQVEEETEKFERARSARDELIVTSEQQTGEIRALNLRVTELQTEVDAGKTMIQQFALLMKDKASAICQYCRRSGTLPPIPSR